MTASFNESMIILSTIHGSHLYGLANENSDIDNYVVVSNNYYNMKPIQTIVDNNDITVIGLKYFMQQIYKGVPQSLEALYSPKTVVDKMLFRHSYYCNSSEVVNTYLRTIKSFSLDERHPYKYNRHALRLTYNLNDIIMYGRFTPVLSTAQIEAINTVPYLTKQEFYSMLKKESIIEPIF